MTFRKAASVVLVIVPISLFACVSEDKKDDAVTPTCDSYCSLVFQKCTGELEQYRSLAECQKVCAFLEPGAAADTAQNTMGCRMHQLQGAATLENCNAAGAFGGGRCGDRCPTFCKIVAGTCLGLDAPPYAGNEGTCNEVCPSLTFDPAEGEGPKIQGFPGKNTLNCRAYHLVLALDAPEPHCRHADVQSAQCL